MMIAARNAFLMGDGKPTARDYVQDGLIAMWDGIENAGWGVHDAAATVWKDLSGGGNDVPVTNAFSWTPNSIESPNSSFVPLAAQSGAFSSSQGTIEAVFSIKNAAFNASFGRVWSADTADSPNYRLALLVSKDSLALAIQCGLINSSKFAETGIATIQRDSIVSATFYRGSTSNMGIVVNGINHALQGFSGVSVGTGKLCMFGDNSMRAGTNIYGSICSLRSYSRALSTAEIAANYEIDAARFGL